jgi:two-component system phosphate regulon response regulator PhoB
MQKHLLIIDDDKDIRDILREVFEPLGYRVFLLPVVYDIFEAINEYRPDLILLDYKLTEGNGADICYDVKSNAGTHHIPIIMLSAYPQDMLANGNHGWNNFMAKPFDVVKLQNMVGRYLSPPQV